MFSRSFERLAGDGWRELLLEGFLVRREGIAGGDD